MNHKSISKFIVGIAAAACALSMSSIAMAQDSASVPAGSRPQLAITVNGSAEVKSKPDTAYVTLGVTTQDKNAATAAQSNAAAINAVINAVIKAGIAKADIETTGYSVSPVMDYPPNKAAVIVGYQVSNQVKVRVRDLTKIGSVLDAATNAGANNVQGIQFVNEADANVKKQALREASLDAQSKAQAIADALGVKLRGVISVTETGYMPPRPLEYAALAAKSAMATPIIPGEVSSTATVTVVFSIL